MLHYFDLNERQVEAKDVLKRGENIALWADMGEGKTVTTATAVVEARDMLPALVIAPLRVARSVWRNEINSWSHLQGLRLERAIGGLAEEHWLHGAKGPVMDALQSSADIVTVNRDIIPWLHDEFYFELRGKRWKQRRRFPFKSLILDEAQSFKNSDGVWFRCLKRLVQLPEQVIELTGTPAPNGLEDLWAEMYLLDKGAALGHGVTDFRGRYMDTVLRDGRIDYVMRSTASPEIYQRIESLVHVLRAPVREQAKVNVIEVELPPAARRNYDQMEEDSITQLFNQQVITAVNAGATTQKLLQLANGAVYDASRVWHETHTEKLEALTEVLDGIPKPVMIAYGFQHDALRCQKVLKGRNFRILDTERDEDDWNAGNIDYLLLHPASAGHGLNLQHSGSTEVVWFGLTHNLEWYQQLNARLAGGHRGAGRNITIHHIIANDTIDGAVLKLLAAKNARQEHLKDALAERRRIPWLQ